MATEKKGGGNGSNGDHTSHPSHFHADEGFFETSDSQVLGSSANAASFRASLSSLSSNDDDVTAHLDAVSSIPLEKKPDVEAQLLREELAEENSALPQAWMGRACIRCRKYDKERSRALMRDMTGLLIELNKEAPFTYENEKEHIGLHKFRLVGRDKLGRACIATDLGYHDPKEVPPSKMVRTAIFLILNALRCGPEGTDEGGESSQLNGISILHNFTNVAWANLDPRLPRLMFKMLSQKLPIRFGNIYIVNPPWFMNYVLLPIARLFMPKKIMGRIIVVGAAANLATYFDLDNLSSKPRDLGGRSKFDPDQWVETHAKDIVFSKS